MQLAFIERVTRFEVNFGLQFSSKSCSRKADKSYRSATTAMSSTANERSSFLPLWTDTGYSQFIEVESSIL